MSDSWRNDPATDKQKAKLAFFGCTWNEGITKGQAHDAIDECVRQFPDREAAYQTRPATEDQLALLRTYLRPDGEEPEDYAEEGMPLTYAQAKDLIAECENQAVVLEGKPSASFKVSCPKCGQHIECPNELFGQSVDCPSCGTLMLAPDSPTSPPPIPETVPPIIAPSSPFPSKPPLWNIVGLLRYHRDRRAAEQALARESRCKYIASILDLIRRGEWSLSLQNVLLMRNEKVLWSEPATLYEWKTVGRHLERTFLKSRGKMVTDKAEAPVAEGAFILTDQRFIFASDEQSFSVKPEKVINIHLFPDGIRFTESGRKKPRALKFHQKNGDVIQAILNQAFAGSS